MVEYDTLLIGEYASREGREEWNHRLSHIDGEIVDTIEADGYTVGLIVDRDGEV